MDANGDDFLRPPRKTGTTTINSDLSQGVGLLHRLRFIGSSPAHTEPALGRPTEGTIPPLMRSASVTEGRFLTRSRLSSLSCWRSIVGRTRQCLVHTLKPATGGTRTEHCDVERDDN